MQRRSERWSVLACCLLAVVALPVCVLAQTPPAATEPAIPAPPPPPADPLAVLRVIPADATAFVAVRNLSELDADIQRLAAKLGFPLESIGFPGPLDFAKENTGIGEGLQANSGLALAVLNCAAVESVDQVPSRLVVFIPSDNSDALIASMGGQKEGDVINLQLMGKPSVAAIKGDFLVVAENPDALKEVLQAKGEGVIKSVAPDQLDGYRKVDLFAWAGMRGISKAIRDEVRSTINGFMAMMNPAAAAPDETMTEQLDKFADECQEGSLGIQVDEKVGLQFVFSYRMRPDTEMARQMAAMKLPAEPLLVGLPDESVIVAAGGAGAGGNELQSQQTRQMFDRIFSTDLLGIDETDEEKTKAIKSLKESLVKLTTELDQVSVSVSSLPIESEDGLIGVAIVGRVPSAAKAQADVRNLFTTSKKLLLDVAVANEELTEEQVKNADAAIQLKQDAEKLTGAAVDHLVVELEKIPNQTDEDIAEIKSVIGQEGVLIRVAAVGEHHLVITFGGGAKRFAQVVDLVQKAQSPLTEKKTFKMVEDRLPNPKERLGVAYFSVDRLLALIMDISGKLGQPVPPMIMEETAPIAYTVTRVDPAALQVDVLIPVELAQSAMKMLKPFIQMMMGGMGGMGGGPDGQPMPDGELR